MFQDLRYPTDCAFDGALFWITDRYRHQVKALDANGNLQQCFGKFGSLPGCFQEPWGICLGDPDTLFVSDFGNQRVQKISKQNGSCLQTIGIPGPGAEYYETPFFKTQNVFRKWTQKQSRFCTLESSFFSSGFTLGTIENPKGLAFADGKLVVADASGRLQVFGESGALFRSHYSLESQARNPFAFMEWVTVFRDELYWSSELSNVIWKLGTQSQPEVFLTLPWVVGRFRFDKKGNILFMAPWEKRLYRISFRE